MIANREGEMTTVSICFNQLSRNPFKVLSADISANQKNIPSYIIEIKAAKNSLEVP